MGRRLTRWGNPRLDDARSYVIKTPLGNAHPETIATAWKTVPHLIGGKKPKDKAGRFERVQDLLTSKTGLHDDDGWYPRRPLGVGGFGVAALFERVDRNGELVDEMVIKTAQTRPGLAVSRDRPWLPQEARIMSMLNNLDNEAVLYLRNIKMVLTTPVTQPGGTSYPMDKQIWRFYLENAPHGDLERLRVRYKAWSQYLPEQFLWHIFKGLMEAAKTLEEGPFEKMDGFGQPFPNSYMVHCDIKPENIFLGAEKQKNGPASEFYYFPNYPMPKLADFGLTLLTSESDKANTPEHFSRGTPRYFAPEVRLARLEDWDDWRYGPFRRQPLKPLVEGKDPKLGVQFGLHKITRTANVWVIGMVMYQLMTLDEPGDLDDAVDNLSERVFDQQLGRVIRSVATQQHPDYSQMLSELVLDCLNLDPEARPRPSRALETIDGWLRYQHENANPSSAMPDGERVFYRGNEINDMNPGDYHFDLQEFWWTGWFNRQEIWLDERWEKLRPPGRPDHLDPWLQSSFYARKRHDRDDAVLVPDSVAQRKIDKLKRRRIDPNTDDTYTPTSVEETVLAPKQNLPGGDQLYAFPLGFGAPAGVANPQQDRFPGGGYIRRDPVTLAPLPNPLLTPTPLPRGVVNSPPRGLQERFPNAATPARPLPGPYRSPAQAAPPPPQMPNNGWQGEGLLPGYYPVQTEQQQFPPPGPYRSPAQMQQQQYWQPGPYQPPAQMPQQPFVPQGPYRSPAQVQQRQQTQYLWRKAPEGQSLPDSMIID